MNIHTRIQSRFLYLITADKLSKPSIHDTKTDVAFAYEYHHASCHSNTTEPKERAKILNKLLHFLPKNRLRVLPRFELRSRAK